MWPTVAGILFYWQHFDVFSNAELRKQTSSSSTVNFACHFHMISFFLLFHQLSVVEKCVSDFPFSSGTFRYALNDIMRVMCGITHITMPLHLALCRVSHQSKYFKQVIPMCSPIFVNFNSLTFPPISYYPKYMVIKRYVKKIMKYE